MQPYTALSDIANIVRKLPQKANEAGMEIRVLMPRFGNINERRHRLHEVVRLSGMNIVVNDDDYPLIIKVASLPGARLQVYFLDNEEFFKRKALFHEDDEPPFEDNPDRMVFFCKGVMETVKKFGWPPDLIHCHGWMTSLVPLYVRTAYKNEPIFKNTQVVYSAYKDSLEETFPESFIETAQIQSVETSDLDEYRDGSAIKLQKGAIHHADAVIKGSDELEDTLQEQFDALEKPTMSTEPGSDYLSSYMEFYKSILETEDND